MANQLELVKYLKEHGPTVTGELIKVFGNSNISRNMSILRKQGYAIHRIVKARYGNTSLWILTDKGEKLRT